MAPHPKQAPPRGITLRKYHYMVPTDVIYALQHLNQLITFS